MNVKSYTFWCSSYFIAHACNVTYGIMFLCEENLCTQFVHNRKLVMFANCSNKGTIYLFSIAYHHIQHTSYTIKGVRLHLLIHLAIIHPIFTAMTSTSFKPFLFRFARLYRYHPPRQALRATTVIRLGKVRRAWTVLRAAACGAGPTCASSPCPPGRRRGPPSAGTS